MSWNEKIKYDQMLMKICDQSQNMIETHKNVKSYEKKEKEKHKFEQEIG